MESNRLHGIDAISVIFIVGCVCCTVMANVYVNRVETVDFDLKFERNRHSGSAGCYLALLRVMASTDVELPTVYTGEVGGEAVEGVLFVCLEAREL